MFASETVSQHHRGPFSFETVMHILKVIAPLKHTWLEVRYVHKRLTDQYVRSTTPSFCDRCQISVHCSQSIQYPGDMPGSVPSSQDKRQSLVNGVELNSLPTI